MPNNKFISRTEEWQHWTASLVNTSPIAWNFEHFGNEFEAARSIRARPLYNAPSR